MLYLDSAQIQDAEQVCQWGWVQGITTNPTLLGACELAPEVVLKKLAEISPGELYYQLMASDLPGMIAEAHKAQALIGEKLVLKIPATPIGFQATAALSPHMICSVTAIYSPAQAAVAQAAGATYAIAYVNRATRLLGDGLALVREMAAVLRGGSTEILAASLKTPEEAAAALQAGADHLTVPLALLTAMAQHPLSDQTVLDFAAGGRGLTL